MDPRAAWILLSMKSAKASDQSGWETALAEAKYGRRAAAAAVETAEDEVHRSG
jgi:hypothetical protein